MQSSAGKFMAIAQRAASAVFSQQPSTCGGLYLGQQRRGLRVKVFNGEVEEAVRRLQRKLVSSGMDRLIRTAPKYHIKKSEQRVLDRKNREYRLNAQQLAAKLKTILINKTRGL